MSQSSRRRSNSIIKLGEHRRNMSSSKKMPSTSHIHGNITNRVDERIQWAYRNIANKNIIDLTSDKNRFPNQMLTEYIQYVSGRYNLVDPIKSRQNINNGSSNYYTPKKQYDNETIAGTNRTLPLKSVIEDRYSYLQRQSSSQQINPQTRIEYQRIKEQQPKSARQHILPNQNAPTAQGRNHIGVYNFEDR